MPSSKMLCDTKLCVESDFIVRTYGRYLYVIDGLMGNLHVYSTKESQWNFSKLADLGI